MKVDSYLWINISWLVWRSVSSRPRDSSETFSASKLVEHRAQSPVRKKMMTAISLSIALEVPTAQNHEWKLTMKVDSYLWINISWLVWRSVSSRLRDSSETVSASKLVEHRAQSPVRKKMMTAISLSIALEVPTAQNHEWKLTMKVDSYLWINISWLVWRSVSSRLRDSSETVSASKLVEHRAQSPVRKEWWQQSRWASRSKSRLHKITSENWQWKLTVTCE